MKAIINSLAILLLMTACKAQLTEPEQINPSLNGVWQSVIFDTNYTHLPLMLHLTEENGRIYGSGSFEYYDLTLEFEITTGVIDRPDKTYKITFTTETLYIQGYLLRATGKLEGNLRTDDELTCHFRLNETNAKHTLRLKRTTGVQWLPKRGHNQGGIL